MEIKLFQTIDGLTLLIPNYYTQAQHVEKPYTDGLYGVLPTGGVCDFLAQEHKYCTSWMEWAYNNPRQPVAEISETKGIPVAFLDASHANAARNLGSLKTIWKAFEKSENLHQCNLDELDINDIEERFWNYYIQKHRAHFNRSVQILEDYVRRRRAEMSAEDVARERLNTPFCDEAMWIAGCKDYLKHLVYTTPRGYMMELVLFAALQTKIGGEFRESDINDERAGIDGFLAFHNETIAISLKPDSYCKQTMSPLYDACWVTYNRPRANTRDLKFVFQSGADKIIDKLPF